MHVGEVSMMSKRLYSDMFIWGNMDIDEIFSPHEIVYGLYLGSADEEESAWKIVDAVFDIRNYIPECPKDGEYINVVILDTLVRELHFLLGTGMKVFVYCQAGMERSPLVFACFLVT